MEWSAESAMRQMWSEMDNRVTNGEMMRFFQRHLQAAFDAGVEKAYADDDAVFSRFQK